MATIRASIILNSRDDWRGWYNQIRSLAKARDIWEYIDPDTAAEQLPDIPRRPQIPELGRNEDENRWKMKMQHYTMQKNEYDEVRRGLAAVNELIHGSVSTLLVHHLYDKESIYDILKALKDYLAPSTEQQGQILLARYEKAREAPIQDQALDHWLSNFEAAYQECQGAGLPEVQGQHAVRHFLQAVSRHSWSWAERRFDSLQQDTSIQLPEIIRIYRGYLADTAAMRARSSDAAFATLKGQADQQAPQQASQHQYPQCICGQYHYFHRCWYLMQSKRPPNWIPRPDIQARFDQILAGPSNPIKEAIQQALQYDTPPPSNTEHAMAMIQLGFEA
ncbi:hypothetical protein BJY01DRAFT_59233 [Aspergillus pseudoustus]|uniref:Uncharacterized protein n=1 Tax=Aspergillus pseudoustus TaxID=1810923 RepID=A0ABR4J8B8_9EURO